MVQASNRRNIESQRHSREGQCEEQLQHHLGYLEIDTKKWTWYLKGSWTKILYMCYKEIGKKRQQQGLFERLVEILRAKGKERRRVSRKCRWISRKYEEVRFVEKWRSFTGSWNLKTWGCLLYYLYSLNLYSLHVYLHAYPHFF